MLRRLVGAATLAAFSLSWTTYGYGNYSTGDMMRAQLALMADTPTDCPTWYDLNTSQDQTFQGHVADCQIVLTVSFLPLPAVNTPNVISSMANAHVHPDMVAMIACLQVRIVAGD